MSLKFAVGCAFFQQHVFTNVTDKSHDIRASLGVYFNTGTLANAASTKLGVDGTREDDL
jgi:hypothetical protein